MSACDKPTARAARRCRHVLHSRCPSCRVEMYAPAVWEFSHGAFPCNCGWTVTPTMRNSS